MTLARASYLAGAISALGGVLTLLQWGVKLAGTKGVPSPLFTPVIAASFVIIGGALGAAPRRSLHVRRIVRWGAAVLAGFAIMRISFEFADSSGLRRVFGGQLPAGMEINEGYFPGLTAVQVLFVAAGLVMVSWRNPRRAADGFGASLAIAVGVIAQGYVIRFFLDGQSEGAPFGAAVLRTLLFTTVAAGLFCSAAASGADGATTLSAKEKFAPEIKLSIAFGTTLGIGLLGGLLCLGLLVRLADDDRHHLQVTRLVAALHRIQYALQASALASTSYLETGREAQLLAYRRSLDDLKPQLRDIARRPVAREQQALVDRMVMSLREQVTAMNSAVERRRSGEATAESTLASRLDLTALLDPGRGQIGRAERELQGELARRARLRAISRVGTQYFLLFGVLGVGAILFGVHVLFERDLAAHRRADAALSRHNETLRSFAHTVAHDLRAPLRGIAGYTRELEAHAPKLDERSRFCLAQIGTAAVHLERLIEDTLDYARLDAEPVQFTLIDLPALVATLIRQRAPQIGEYGAEITTRFGVTTLVSWSGGLAQIVGNLLDNALKYSRNSHPSRIRIETSETPGTWRIAVHDNGVGFDMKYHDRIFGLFQRLVPNSQFEGTGAGLAIVRKIADRLGGTVRAESVPGDGATFVVEFPKATALPGTTQPA